MLVGFLGDIAFRVSSNYLRTFDEYNRNASGRWAKHDIIGRKPTLEFLGPDVEKISFKMQFRADYGINPREELKRLRNLCDTGQALTLVIGNKVIGDNYWIIESVDENVTYWSREGQILSVTANVTLQEYVGGVI